MIDDNTRSTIDSWIYGSNGLPSNVSPLSAEIAGQASGAMMGPGMIGAATSTTPTTTFTPTSTWANLATSTISPADLTHRTVDPAKETVAGQMNSVLSADSPLLQQARSDAMRTANERGMLNSTMAASGGTDAMIRSALNVATPDAAYYNHAADYNAAADNQATMYNADQKNQTDRLKSQLQADEQTRAQQLFVAQMQDSTSRYNTDANFRQQADANKKSLVNNILQNPDISPDRKAAMLEQLGEGTSAHTNPDGSYAPGTGMAGAVYVIDSVAADLRPGSGGSSEDFVVREGSTMAAWASHAPGLLDQIEAHNDAKARERWQEGRL